MTKFPYENLSDDDFETLVIRVSNEILGIGCKTFTKGRDGAKDSWFDGTANCFPSAANPWKGKFCIQAKHTTSYNASCSDNDFSVNKSSILSKEIERLKVVITENSFDNYILFTNRKLSGDAHPRINKILSEGIGINNVEIIGREQLDDYLSAYPHIGNKFGLHKFLEPLRFYEKDLKAIILLFNKNIPEISKSASDFVIKYDLAQKEKKNELNNLSKEYFDYILENSLDHFRQVDDFLKNPKNTEFMKMYSNTVSDLQEVIVIERNRFAEFEHIIKHIYDQVLNNHSEDLKDMRDLVRIFIHFMYFNCDIGKSK